MQYSYNRLMNRIIVFILVGVLLIACSSQPSSPSLILATTTSTQDSGFLDVLIPLFEKQTGYVVKVIAVGTGQALKMGEEGNADVLLVHAPISEEAFMEGGFGKDRAPVMHNDFIVVGPESDPAQIKGTVSAIDILKRIYNSGALFISRGDDSGTHKKELEIWGKAGLDPKGQAWYLESGQGMGATLMIASQKKAYTLSDRATYLSFKDKVKLVILSEGDTALLNPYHVIEVNQAKFTKVNAEGARAFSDFIVSPAIQKVIAEFGKEQFGGSLFFPDAK